MKKEIKEKMNTKIEEKIEEIIRSYVGELCYQEETELGCDEKEIPLMVKEISELFSKEKQKLTEDIKDLQIKVSSPNSEYINKLPQIQILDEVLEIIEREIKK